MSLTNYGTSIPRVVVDTNVLFSALALERISPPGRVLELAHSGRIHLIASPFILAELARALVQKAGWDAERVRAAGKKLKGLLTLVEPSCHVDVVRRKDSDNRVLECALDSRADVLVTGNMKDLRPLGAFAGIAILTPREFLDRYFPPRVSDRPVRYSMRKRRAAVRPRRLQP